MIENKPEIIDVFQRENIEIKQRGNSWWAKCPLHEEKTPSLELDTGKQVFYCFGCGEGGDVIAFIQKFKGLSFKDAIAYLGITNKPYKVDRKLAAKRKLANEFREWCHIYYCKLCDLLKELDKKKRKARNMDDVEKLARFYHEEPIWDYHSNIIFYGSDDDKLKLYREVKHG